MRISGSPYRICRALGCIVDAVYTVPYNNESKWNATFLLPWQRAFSFAPRKRFNDI